MVGKRCSNVLIYCEVTALGIKDCLMFRYFQTLHPEHTQSATFYMFTLHLKGNNFMPYGAPENKPEREAAICGLA